MELYLPVWWLVLALPKLNHQIYFYVFRIVNCISMYLELYRTILYCQIYQLFRICIIKYQHFWLCSTYIQEVVGCLNMLVA